MNKDTIIEINNLKMNFGSKEVLKGIDLKIHKGSIIGYIGPNGAGKSTTVKIILGPVESGRLPAAALPLQKAPV